jgi:hypothetical protein
VVVVLEITVVGVRVDTVHLLELQVEVLQQKPLQALQ